MTKHGKHERVKTIFSMNGKESRDAIDLLRKEALYKANHGRAVTGEEFLCERRQGNSEKKICGNCHGYFSSKKIIQHLRRCTKNDQVATSQKPIILSNVVRNDFEKEVVSHFRTDSIGKVIKYDNFKIINAFVCIPLFFKLK